MRTAYFTICSSNYLAYAQTLYASLLAADPEAAENFVLFLADEPASPDALPDLPFRVVLSRDLGIPTFWDMALRYSIMEFNTAIKPSCFQYLFDRDGYESVIYLDPDIYVLRPLAHVTRALEEGANLVLTPHITAPLGDDGDPDDIRILRTGCYNLGFLGARRSADVNRLMAWWADHLTEDCRVDLEHGLFVDQKFMDLAPSICSDTVILRHAGYNTAYWNLAHRPIEQTRDGWAADGMDLHFFHFSGVVPENRNVFSKHQNRFTLDNIGELKGLLNEYLDQINAFDHAGLRQVPYAYARFTDGTPIPDVYRAAFGRRNPARELTREQAFAPEFDWVLETDPATHTAFKPFPVSYLLHEIWLRRPDLQKEFPISSPQGREALIRWFFCSAPVEYKLPPVLVERMSAKVRGEFGRAEMAGMHAGNASLTHMGARLILDQVPKLRGLYRLLPQDLRTGIRSRLLRAASTTPTGELSALNLSSRGGLDPKLKPGVSVYGYFQTVSGVGEAVRRNVSALDAAGLMHAEHVIPAPDEKANVLPPPAGARHGASDLRVAIIHANADQTEPVLSTMPARNLSGKYRIGYWAWELAKFPDVWRNALNSYDEIWVPSEFVRDAVAVVTELPVEVIPHPVDMDVPEFASYPGIEPGRFHFLCCADLNSYAARKNLLGAYEAFIKAFPDPQADSPKLVAKIHGSGVGNQSRQSLFDLLSGDPRVICIDTPLTAEEYRSLQCACDAYVSLHRSEGFGMNIAECLALGKAVVATGYGGCMDFMNEANALVVPHVLRPVEPGEYLHGDGQEWAEPDLDVAAELLRKAFEGGAAIDALRQAGRKMAETHSFEMIGRKMAARIGEIEKRFS